MNNINKGLLSLQLAFHSFFNRYRFLFRILVSWPGLSLAP